MNAAFYTMLSVTIFSVLALAVVFVMERSSSVAHSKIFLEIVSPRRILQSSRQAPAAGARLLEFVRVLRSSLKLTDDPNLHRQFERAALQPSKARDVYFAARYGGPMLMLILGSFSPYARILCMCAGAGIAYLAPAIVLGKMVRKHREGVRLAIPDAVDLLVICVDAGLGLDQAMVRVGEELEGSHPAIHHEFGQISREQRAGKQRLQAWREMAERISLTETDALVNMLMQTERFGTPIARALSSFGDTIRQKRRQKAEEAAAKTTIKIIFPLVFFIFPCIFIVLLGPAAISIFRNMGTAGH